MRGTPGKQFQPHRLYSWDELGAVEKRQLRGGLPDDITLPRYFMHMGLWFDSKQFDKTPNGEWFTDGSPVHIKVREYGKLEVGIQLYGRIIRVQPAKQPEQYKGKTVAPPPTAGHNRKLPEPLPPEPGLEDVWRANPPEESNTTTKG